MIEGHSIPPGTIRTMSLGEVLDALYDSEINFSVSCFWDNGIDVKLGDELNGFKAEGNVGRSEEAAAWLDFADPQALSALEVRDDEIASQ